MKINSTDIYKGERDHRMDCDSIQAYPRLNSISPYL